MTLQEQPVRWISRRGENFDRFVVAQMEHVGFGREGEYFGIKNPARAEDVRRGLRRSGKRLGVAVKAYTADCSGCRDGGPECRHHILFTVYDMESARAYMAAKAAALKWGARR